jgi:hypothetical protein
MSNEVNKNIQKGEISENNQRQMMLISQINTSKLKNRYDDISEENRMENQKKII